MKGNLSRIADAWNDEGAIAETPTFETIGKLADFLNKLDVEVAQIAECRDSIVRNLRVPMIMRDEVEAAGG